MTPESLAALHARSFSDAPRPWTVEEFARLLGEPGVFHVARPGGFAVGRVSGPEVELLTLAVVPEARRRGLGAALVADFEAQAALRGAEEVFLEVAVTNAAGRALYQRAGYELRGRRPGYYARRGQLPIDALVLGKPLAAAKSR
jgi:ribosomal-protein-alanine N-acetyltransferase